MTTSIYFLLMSLTLFVFPQLVVRFLLGYPVWDKRIRLLIYAAVLPTFWYVAVPHELNDMREINFLQHAIGGVSVGFVALYFISVFKQKFDLSLGNSNIWNNFFVQAVLVYICVSSLGVANELLEFLLDWAGVGIFSADRYDSWFDLLANTTGAGLVFVFYKLFNVLFKRV